MRKKPFAPSPLRVVARRYILPAAFACCMHFDFLKPRINAWLGNDLENWLNKTLSRPNAANGQGNDGQAQIDAHLKTIFQLALHNLPLYDGKIPFSFWAKHLSIHYLRKQGLIQHHPSAVKPDSARTKDWKPKTPAYRAIPDGGKSSPPLQIFLRQLLQGRLVRVRN